MTAQRKRWWLSHMLAYILGAWGGGWSITAIHDRAWGALIAILGLMVAAVWLDFRWDRDRRDGSDPTRPG